MVSSLYRRLFFSMTASISLVMFMLLFVGFPGSALAEWYVAGFGGLSMPGSLSDTKMDTYGERLAFQQFPGAAAIPPNGTLTQSFNTSDIGLKNSASVRRQSRLFFQGRRIQLARC